MNMRPFELDPLFQSITTLPAVGIKTSKLIEKLINGSRVLDLLYHTPIDFIDRRYSPMIAQAAYGKIATMKLCVAQHFPNTRKSLPYRIRCTDESGEIFLIFFHAKKSWLEQKYPIGKTFIASGKVEHFHTGLQMVHPETTSIENRSSLETIEPIYPLTQGVTNKTLRKAISGALQFIPTLDEWLDTAHKQKNHWNDWCVSLIKIHQPETESDLDPLHASRMRLAYDELLANQLTLAIARLKHRQTSGRAFSPSKELKKKIIDSLPYSLTNSQLRVLDEINADMASPSRMLRLLQGDVGSGKTIVACLTMANAIENNAQAALLAPTEILARQHEFTLKPLLDAAGIHSVTLTGRDKGHSRDKILQNIKDGTAQIIVGTHAIFQNDVMYKNLGLCVIDEQHRFGVQQRLELSNKGKGVDILMMTATPIPRSLALTAYGDMEVSRIDEKPPGRKPVETVLIPQERLEEIISGLKRQISEGVRVYWVCPLVEESEVSDLSAAQERFDVLHSFFPDRVGLIHGRMKPLEKDESMRRFANGEIDILVATSVIEVGVNVPEASVMIIEHAERFGLSQLHQLRGRVGRGSKKSYCLMIYTTPLSQNAKERLSIMRETEDGFIIAEKDLQLRGGGDIMGLKQSGNIDFRIADLNFHSDLLVTARNDANLILHKDPHLESARGKALKTLLYLFERDAAIKYFKSG